MRIQPTHDWDIGYREAVELQTALATQIRFERLPIRSIRYVAGSDIAISKRLGKAVAAVAVFRYPSLELVESRSATADLRFPYIPGLLSFREIPVLIRCLARVKTPFDVMICDGQGIAHPRGLGLASHLGLLMKKPTIGCAKSILVGEHDEIGVSRGDLAPLVYKGKRVGTVVRTRDNGKPVYVSPGHLVDQSGACRLILGCARRYRLPEPTRQTDRIAGQEKRRLEAGVTGDRNDKGD
jgi:deoxyribonuclease V